VVVCALLPVLLAACGEEFASGYVWATNDSESDVLVRIVHRADTGWPFPLRRQTWLVAARSRGFVTNANSGEIQVLEPGTCSVIGAQSIDVFPWQIVIKADFDIEVIQEGPGDGVDPGPDYALVEECLAQ
jgi:hypothetical protein